MDLWALEFHWTGLKYRATFFYSVVHLGKEAGAGAIHSELLTQHIWCSQGAQGCVEMLCSDLAECVISAVPLFCQLTNIEDFGVVFLIA